MEKIKVALVTTCLNEERTINLFLRSILKQTQHPDQIIIVDGGSSDKTIDHINEFITKYPRIKLKLIIKRGNRSTGRNTAINESNCEIIACTDVGCEMSVNWLERITHAFLDKSIQVVAGYYKPVTTSVFEECLATYTCTMPDKLDKNHFLPSSRSIAFRKYAWKKVGGYPENLDTCEDLVFARKLLKSGMIFKTEDKALVYWPQRRNIWLAAVQFFSYATGDGQGRYFRKNTYFLFFRYILAILFVYYILILKNNALYMVFALVIIIYVIWAIWKNYRYVKKWRALYILPALQLVSDVTVITGTIVGLVKGIFK